jgi:ferritin-like metal-binding protein YciE
MSVTTLQDLYLEELKDLLSAENQILKALPKMAKATHSSDLRGALEEHLEQTKGHVERLEQILDGMGEKPRPKKCKGMEGILSEGSDFLKEAAGTEVVDAGLIAGAQRVEHYEIAAYGSVRSYAELLGQEEAAELLQLTLDEEITADEKLTQLAESGINSEANTGS